jgi:thiamine-phosphate pyrophosphorylase
MPLRRTHGIICLVTDRRRLAATAPSTTLAEFVGTAADAGVDLIQIRERDMEAGDLVDLVKGCVGAAEKTSAAIVVNERADVAMAAGAHGVHLRSDSFDAGRLRTLVPSTFIIGRSLHDAGEAAATTRQGGTDYVILGTMFPTESKPRSVRLQTLQTMTGLAAASPVPVLPIGGITLDRAAEVARAGAHGVAAIGLFLPPKGISLETHLHTVVRRLRHVFDTCRAVP